MLKHPPEPNHSPRFNPLLAALFGAYSRRYVARHFHTVRILSSGLPTNLGAEPVVVFLNHASWWDPLVCLLLHQRFFRDRPAFTPIDAVALQKYRFFQHLGFFGIERDSRSGATTFLAVAQQVLRRRNQMIWMTPQGCFSDVRTRPLKLQAGMAHVAVRHPGTIFLPLALEYTFWSERTPEVLVNFGEPWIAPPSFGARGAVEPTLEALTERLVHAQNRLAAAVIRRHDADFSNCLEGRVGVGGIYDLWRAARAWRRGEQFSSSHV